MLRGITLEVCCRPNPEEVCLDIGPSVHTKAMYPHIDKFDSDLIRARDEIWKPRACGDGYQILAKVFRIRRQLHGTRLRPRKYCHPSGTLVHRHDHRPIHASHREQPSVGALLKHSHRAASQLGHGHPIRPEIIAGHRRHRRTSRSHFHGDHLHSFVKHDSCVKRHQSRLLQDLHQPQSVRQEDASSQPHRPRLPQRLHGRICAYVSVLESGICGSMCKCRRHRLCGLWRDRLRRSQGCHSLRP
jgi:hypothetical protein